MVFEVNDDTVDAADAYFLTRLNSGMWNGSDSADKKSALVTAAHVLSTFGWSGKPYRTDYAFPRYIIQPANHNDFVTSAVVLVTPLAVSWAVFEQAIHLLTNPGLLAEESTVESLVLGPIGLQKIKDVPMIPKIVNRLLSPYLSASPSGGATWWRNN